MKVKRVKIISNVISVLLIVGYLIYLYAVWDGLPESVPIHFDIHGVPDRYGNKGSLLFEPILGALILGLMMFVENYPELWNWPYQVTEKNKEKMYLCMTEMVAWIKVLGVIICLYAGFCGNLSRAPMWPDLILIGGLFAVVIISIIKMRKISG